MNTIAIAIPVDANPVHLIYTGAAFTLLFFFIAISSSGFLKKMIFWILTLSFLAPTLILVAGKNPWLVNAQHLTYKRFYWSIHRNMTREEVLDSMQSLYPPTSTHPRPVSLEDSYSTMVFVMGSEFGPRTLGTKRESITLRMEAGKVIGKDYSSE